MAAPPHYSVFTEEFRAPGQALIEPKRFATAVHLQIQELARLAGVHRATVAESPANARLQRFMRETLQVLSAAIGAMGEPERAIYWYRNTPIPQFQYHTAEQLIADQQTQALLSYLVSPGALANARRSGRALLDSHHEEIIDLCQRYAVQRLGVFGSALRADFDPAYSDIDLAVDFGPAPDRTPSGQYFDFKAALEQLLECRVDLIELAAMPDSRLRRLILRTQLPLYGQAA